MNLNIEHFEHALTVIRPSSMREVILEVPKVKWSDIGGQHELKKRLEEMVVWPLKYAHALDRLHVQVPKGILMYGPPGCSKTMVAKAIATESGLNFIAVKVNLLYSLASVFFMRSKFK
jgi:AAA family ATPase